MTIRVTDKFRDDALACLVQIVRDEGAPSNARAQAAKDILAYSLGRPSQAKQAVTVADLALLSEDQRRTQFRALVEYYHQDIGLDELIAQAVDEALKGRRPQPKITFRRGTPVPAPPSTPIVADSAHARPRSRGEGPRSMQGSGPDQTALQASGWASPVDPHNLHKVGDDPNSIAQNSSSSDRSTRLAELALEFMPRKKSAPPLAADSGDGMAHALRLSRLSASELEARYFGGLPSGDHTIWRGRR